MNRQSAAACLGFPKIRGQQLESSCLAPGPSPDLFSAQIWVVQIVFRYEGQLFSEHASAGVVILGNLQVGHPRGCGGARESVLWVFLGWGAH